jgi:hypothetical protein
MLNWSFSKNIHWHGKGFSLEWNFPSSWLVIIHFHNGETKPWYRRTERPYRFRRWFFRKGKGRFQNLANFRHPFVKLFVFRGWSPFPVVLKIPMEVRILRVQEPEARILNNGLKAVLSPFRKVLMPMHLQHPQARIKSDGPKIKGNGIIFKPSAITPNFHSNSKLEADFFTYRNNHP